MATRKHSRIGASSAKRWLNCPGSVRMQRGLPDTSSEAADEGTAAHELAEMALKKGTKNVAEYRGMTIRVEESGREFVVDEEMTDAVQLYVDIIRRDRDEMGSGVKGSVEKMFSLESVNKELYGTNDASLAQPFGALNVYDLKYGRGVAVEAEDNDQMKIYALGALEEQPLCEDVELIIVQPRCPHPEGPERRWSITSSDLQTWSQKVLKPGAEKALREDAPVNAGEWCRFCKAQAICPAIVERAQALASVAFEEPVFPAPATMSGDEISKVLAFSKMFSSWATEVQSFARAQMDRGVKVPGYKLVQGRKSRSWADEKLAETHMYGQIGDAAYSKPALKSVAQAEKALKEEGYDKDEIAHIFESLVRVDQSLAMAPETDKRPEVIPAIEAFND